MTNLDILYRECDNEAEILEVIEATLDVMAEANADDGNHAIAERLHKAQKHVSKLLAA